MKKNHSILRAEQRYSIAGFNPKRALKEIFNNRCIQLNDDLSRFSKTFLIRYENKYIKVVVDYNLRFIKTLLPQSTDINLINQLILKINNVAA